MTIAACPSCAGVIEPLAQPPRHQTPTHALYLPHIHCAACIRTVEDTLTALPDVAYARVNLSQRRVAIAADALADPAPWIEALARSGFEAHEASERDAPSPLQDDLVLRVGVAGFAMMNVMLLSVAIWSGAADVTREMFHWISATIALPATAFSAKPFFVNALSSLRLRRLNMDVPISLAILLASGLSLAETIQGGEHAYFDAALSLTFFLLAGRLLEARMRRAARSAAADLAALEPRRTWVETGGIRASVMVKDLEVGDSLWLPAGSRLPVEATLLSPQALIDRSAITGESNAVTLVRGSHLIAGDVLLNSPITACATAVGEDTTLRRMVALAQVAEGARSTYTSLADRAARAYVPLVHGLAAAAFAGWAIVTGDLRQALNVAIATLIVTCPCALGLAVPAVATAATGRMFRRGLLVKSETALERLAQIDTVVFDKTGTLTSAALTPDTTMPQHARAVLRSLADATDHPLCRSLRASLADSSAIELTDIQEHTGQGISANLQGKDIRLGQADWVGAANMDGTAFRIAEDVFTLHRQERLLPDAAAAVASLKQLGLTVHILTGDTQERATSVAAKLDADHIHADAKPEDKQALIAALQSTGHKVLMVGDGLNDTVALAEAWASIAPGTALEASRSAADVVLLDGTLAPIAQAIQTARNTRKRILENFGLAASYNAVAIPLAILGFVTPLLAALAMSLSSITVTLNALRVR